MENTKLFIDELDGSEHIIIQTGENAFISMPKSTYDAMQAEQSTPIGTEE
jgi:hypothetical protein